MPCDCPLELAQTLTSLLTYKASLIPPPTQRKKSEREERRISIFRCVTWRGGFEGRANAILLLFHSRSVFSLSLSINVIPDPDFFWLWNQIYILADIKIWEAFFIAYDVVKILTSPREKPTFPRKVSSESL